MFDIHTHILPLVDDGSNSWETSFQMLKDAAGQGITDIILTPHLQEGQYECSREELVQKFNELNLKKESLNIDLNLYLGQEIYIRKDYAEFFEKNRILTINNTKCVLIEFDTQKDFDISETVYDLKRLGFIAIIAHFERYYYADVSVAQEVKQLGGYIQINADSLVGKGKRLYYKKVKQLLKENLVDFVASDVHDFRENHLKKAFEMVERKFGLITAQNLFYNNAKKIIKG